MNTPKLISRGLITIAVSTFFFSTGFYLLIVIMSAYAMDNFRASSAEAGMASSLFVIGSLLSRLAFGRLIEKSGQKKMFCIGLISNFLTTLLYFVADNILMLYGIRFIHGAAFGIITSVSATIVANIVPNKRRGEGIALYGLSITLGTAIGPFLGMFLYQYASYTIVFAGSAMAAVLGLAAGFFTSVSEVKLTATQVAELNKFTLRNFLEPRAIPISILLAVIYIGYSSITGFLTPYAREINLLDSASFFFIVYAAIVFVSRPLVGRLLDLKGANVIMYPAILVFAAGIFLVSQSHSGFVLLLAAALLGLACGNIQPSVQTITVQISPQHRLGLANSTFFIFLDMGVALGPVLFGILLPYAGYRNLFAYGAIMGLACIFLYYILHGKKAARMKADTALKPEL
ncbi:MAG: MFS transporter [Dehalococcoidales bacterium]|nr:MFS transporter [Dehalococcoidales bacterium]